MVTLVPGEWMEDEFCEIANLGINRIISLLEHQEAIDVGLAEEAITQKYGMDYINYPIPDLYIYHSYA